MLSYWKNILTIWPNIKEREQNLNLETFQWIGENLEMQFKKSQFPIFFMNWEEVGNIHSPRPTFQNPNVESMDELEKLMS